MSTMALQIKNISPLFICRFKALCALDKKDLHDIKTVFKSVTNDNNSALAVWAQENYFQN